MLDLSATAQLEEIINGWKHWAERVANHFHDPSPRGTHRELPSSLPAHSLRIEKSTPVIDPDNSGMPWPHHKIGGRPVFLDSGSDLQDRVREMLAQGFDPVLQLCFPNNRDALLDVNWPFGDMNFHVLFKSGTRTEFRFIWG